jgi:type II secretory pathway component GspD/PulD (secretin)
LKKEPVPQPAAKHLVFEMRDKPWGSVLEWLADQTGMTHIANHFPPGKCTFIPPANKTYTISELIDALNEALTQQGYLLIRRDQSFTVVPTGLPIDPAVLPLVKPEELDQRGANELVTVILPLGELDAGDMIADVRWLFSKFGDATILSRTNQLLLQDTAGNLKKVVQAIKEIEAKQPAKAAAKTFSLEFRDSPWPDVFVWLREITELPVVGEAKPTGTFTFVAPATKTLSIPEIIDIVNDALTAQKLMLIRRSHSFALVPTDEPIDPALVPRVKTADLSSRGNSELVSLVVPVMGVSPDDVAMEAERVMGPLGRVTPLSKANQVILQDTVGNLKRVIDTIRAMEEKQRRRS